MPYMPTLTPKTTPMYVNMPVPWSVWVLFSLRPTFQQNLATAEDPDVRCCVARALLAIHKAAEEGTDGQQVMGEVADVFWHG